MIKGRPIEEIKWKGDTPHVDYPNIKNINEAVNPPPLTSELIWIPDSHTGDYHNNTNGKMFMKLITPKVIPLAALNYPVVQMVPVMDNALYHHVSGIQYLTCFSNNSTVRLMKVNGINYVLLLLNNDRISLLPEQYNCTINIEHLRIPFNKEMFQGIKLNQTLSKLHQTNSSRSPQLFG